MKFYLLIFLAVMLAGRAPAMVSLSTTSRGVTMSNGTVSAKFDADGRLRRFEVADTGDLLGHGGEGYFDMTPADKEKGISTSGARYSEIRNAPELAEIAFTKRMTNSEIEVHYVMRAGEAGLYVFAVHRHAAGMEPIDVAQKRYVLRVDPKIFTYAVAARDRHGPMPAPAVLAKSEMVQDAAFRQAGGAVYTKYDWAEFRDGHWGHGLCSTNTGLWMIFGSTEYFMGGPTKQELTVHQTDSTPVELAMFTGEHFLGKPSIQHIEGDWAMLYGPVFIYANKADSPQKMFTDASVLARKMARSWPYSWMNHPLYPLSRGDVTGRLNITDGTSVSNATVILAAAEPDWQLQWKSPVYSTYTDVNGYFKLPAVAAGTYTLYSFVPGVLDEFRRDRIEVKAGADTDTGALTWMPQTNGKMLWQIGTPDRTAGEFKHGGEPRRYGMLASYPKEFPGGVNFVIGKSRERDDWNFAQPIVVRKPTDTPVSMWNIRFACTNAMKGTATLSVAVAGCDAMPTLDVLVNDSSVGKVRLSDDGCLRRSATLAGRYELHKFQFDAAKIRSGENLISLQLSNRGPWGAVMYDCIRLEVAE